MMADIVIFIVVSAFLSLLLIINFPKTIGFKAGLLPVLLSAGGGIYLVITYWNSENIILEFPWFKVGHTHWNFELVIDAAAIMMLGLISFIGLLVYWFSMSYLYKEKGLKRYFILLVLFMLSMYGLVLSGNLFQLFFFWELVGFCSFGLIGFYYKKMNAARAAKKAFIVNRVADIFIVAGLGLIYQQHNTLSLEELSGFGAISIVAGICLFIGACGKSAQYPFAIWLPDAMAGPTPVSAFIHAATMVTSGVILVARIYFLLPQEVLVIMAFTGALTATLGAIAALVQHDIKKVLAYSTISQLGYMFAGLGSGVFDASLFHLFTHAFFKAGLFLNAGAVIMLMKKMKNQHQLEFDVQDMRYMGGLRKHMPLIFASFTLCALALIGVPLFSGYLSKDAIIAGAFGWAQRMGSPVYFLVPDLAFITIILTAIYMIRMWSLIFLGDLKLSMLFPGKDFNITHVRPAVRISAVLLGAMSLGFAVSLNPFDVGQNWVMPGIRNYLAFSRGSSEVLIPSANHIMITGISVLMISLGAFYAWRRYRPSGKYHLAYVQHEFKKDYLKTAYKHYYLDRAYQLSAKAFIKTGLIVGKGDKTVIDRLIHGFAIFNVVLAHIIKMTDKHIIDGVVKFSSLFAAFMGKVIRSLTSGKIQSHITTAIVIFVIFLMIIML